MTEILHIVTGPSGSGKSEFCKQQTDWEYRLYNLDDWARSHGDVEDPRVRESGWRAIVNQLHADMRDGLSPIALDHILDSRAIDEVVEPARGYGYEVCLTVVCPGSAEVCVERVDRRKKAGGHGRSPATVRQFYENALHVAAEASLICDTTNLVDSSGHGMETVANIERFQLNFLGDKRPHWVDRYFCMGRR
ncbi:MAG: AAA family ATPase [Gammaproteobacteria bacterium]|nr:AAA family ATPase [Gammaproteobacteria bacterium]MDE0364935.1 AAA family ATPase [Gammaproteobacteria bacterium]